MTCKSLMTLAVMLLLGSSCSRAAEDGAALYKSKCAGCHGANGEGKPAIKAPALKGTTLDVKQITDHLTKGEPTSKPPHNKGMAGMTDDQATAIAQFVKTLK
jgi:mono/diheme cytochrome c family protein